MPTRMSTSSTGRSSRRLAIIWLIPILVVLPACQDMLQKRPYSAARPSYGDQTPVLNPMRLGGYAGYNYGPGRRIAPDPVIPIEGPIRIEQPLEPIR